MIGLVAVGLVTIFIAESANARAIYYRRSVDVTVTGDQAGDTFVTDIFGLPANGDVGCGLIKGDVYCLDNDAENDKACDMATGYSAALVLGADLDLIKPKTKPYRWTDSDLNSDISDFGQRRQLRVMEELALSEDPDIFTITLAAGETDNKAGIHAISNDVVAYWKESSADSVDAALRRFVGDWKESYGEFIPDDGFGINSEQYLQGLPGLGVTPITGSKLEKLEGHIVCWVVHSDQINGDDLHGKYRGTFAGKVISTTNSSVTIETLDSDDVCNLTLYNDINTVPGEVFENTGCTKYDDVEVFAPAPCSGVTYVDDAFPEKSGTISCGDRVCKGTVELELDLENDANGDLLCPNGTFKKFIPKNLGVGDYADYAYIGVVTSDNTALDELVICGDDVPGGAEGVEYMRYGCVPLEDVLDPAVIPDCCSCVEWGQEP